MTTDFDCCADRAARTRSPLISPEVLAAVRAADYLVLDPDDTVAAALMDQAISTPGRFVKRAISVTDWPWPEPMQTWRRRAVIAALTKQQGAQQ